MLGITYKVEQLAGGHWCVYDNAGTLIDQFAVRANAVRLKSQLEDEQLREHKQQEQDERRHPNL